MAFNFWKATDCFFCVIKFHLLLSGIYINALFFKKYNQF